MLNRVIFQDGTLESINCPKNRALGEVHGQLTLRESFLSLLSGFLGMKSVLVFPSCLQNAVFYDPCIHECTVVVIGCVRRCLSILQDGQGRKELILLSSGELLALDNCCQRVIFFHKCGLTQVAQVPADGPIPGHVWVCNTLLH